MRRYVQRVRRHVRRRAHRVDTIGRRRARPTTVEREPEPEREPDAGDAVLGRAPSVAGADAAGDVAVVP